VKCLPREISVALISLGRSLFIWGVSKFSPGKLGRIKNPDNPVDPV
jgi:hypothetical protein